MESFRVLSRSSDVDVLVVGAGPAGSSAARAAAEAGATVLVLEKRPRIGEPVQCAEYIPRPLADRLKFPSEVIAQEIRGMVSHLPGGEVVRKAAPGFILNRDKFDQALASGAAEAGAQILRATRAIGIKDRKVTAIGPTGKLEFRTRVIVGADGPRSTVGSCIGQRNRQFVWALQQTVVLKEPASDTEVYFAREYPGGYAWLFPKGEVAHLGVGVKRELGGIPKVAIRAFKERVRDRIGRIVGLTAGLIPVGGPLAAVDEAAAIILAGDAAGQAHPITGAGIAQALICGAMAGKAAAAYSKGQSEALQAYWAQWRKHFGPMMDMAVEKRAEMERDWDSENLTELLRRCWVAFKEYYRGP